MSRWSSYFMGVAFLTAMQSKDQSTQVGAVIVGPDNEIRSTGFNGPPRGFNDNAPVLTTDKKNLYMVHAEQNAILNAVRIGVSIKDCDLYVTLRPCSNCALQMVNAGIKRIIFHHPAYEYYLSQTGTNWNFDLTDEILGHKIESYDDPLATNMPIKIRSKFFFPAFETLC